MNRVVEIVGIIDNSPTELNIILSDKLATSLKPIITTPENFLSKTITTNFDPFGKAVVEIVGLESTSLNIDTCVSDATLEIQTEMIATGPRGEPGIGIEIAGSLETIDDLPSTGTLGTGYLIEGDLWIWTKNGYENVGHIQGPKGDEGKRGPEGPVGPIGTADYTDLLNRPSIQSIELIGNRTFEELGIIPISQEEIVNIL